MNKGLINDFWAVSYTFYKWITENGNSITGKYYTFEHAEKGRKTITFVWVVSTSTRFNRLVSLLSLKLKESYSLENTVNHEMRFVDEYSTEFEPFT